MSWWPCLSRKVYILVAFTNIYQINNEVRKYKMENEYSDAFYATLRKTNAGTYEVTIPVRNIRFEGWEEGDELKLIAKRLKKKEE
jgi:hypothetical protein